MNVMKDSIKQMKKARGYFEVGDNLSALKILDEIFIIDPNNEYAKLLYADIISCNDKEKAYNLLQKLSESNKDEIKYGALYSIGKLLVLESKYYEAKPYFEKVLKDSSYRTISSCIQLYKYYSRIEINYKKGYSILEKYGDNRSSKVLFYKAEAVLKMGDIEKADKIINHARKTNIDERRKFKYMKGEVENKKRNYSKALELYDEIIDENIDDRLHYCAILEKAVIKSIFSLYDEAIELCEDIIMNQEKYKNRALVVENLVYIRCNNYDKAIESLRMMTKRFENDINYYLRFAKTEFYFKNYEKTLEIYNKMAKMPTCTSDILDEINYWSAITKYKLKTSNPLESIKKINNRNLLHDKYKHIDVLIKILTNNINSYTSRQLKHYDINEAISHIDKVHLSYNEEKSYFSKDVDISKLIDEISNEITDDKLVENKLFETYRIHYENIGYINGIPTDTLEVVTLPNEKKILTMYPVLDYKMEEKAKIKQKSQIEKFYERYGKTS